MTVVVSPELRTTVESLASQARNHAQLTERAAAIAEAAGAAAIAQLRTLYHGDPIPPPQYAEEFSGLGQWLSARQRAIFEIYFHFGREALPELRSVAFGEYDWIQGNALEILCRLAAADVEREVILREIAKEAPNLRDEALLYAVEPLIPYEESSSGLREVLAFLKEQGEFKWAYDLARRRYLERVRLSECVLVPRAESADMKPKDASSKPWWKFW